MPGNSQILHFLPNDCETRHLRKVVVKLRHLSKKK